MICSGIPFLHIVRYAVFTYSEDPFYRSWPGATFQLS